MGYKLLINSVSIAIDSCCLLTYMYVHVCILSSGNMPCLAICDISFEQWLLFQCMCSPRCLPFLPSGPFLQMDAEAMEDVKKMWRTMHKLSRTFSTRMLNGDLQDEAEQLQKAPSAAADLLQPWHQGRAPEECELKLRMSREICSIDVLCTLSICTISKLRSAIAKLLNCVPVVQNCVQLCKAVCSFEVALHNLWIINRVPVYKPYKAA